MQDPSVVLTEECTLIYPDLFEPSTFGNETEPKYRATFLFNQGTDMTPFREACRYAAQRKFGSGVPLNSLRYPIRDGNEKAIDENGKPDPNNFYYNRMFIAAKSKFKIPIVNVYNEEITNEEEIYGGCIVRAYLSFYGYAYMGNGVAVGLRAVCKVSDGEPLGGGRINTGEVFKDFIKPKDTFMDQVPGTPGQLGNELGQQNHDPLTDSNPWGNNEPPQEPTREPGDEVPEDLPF